MGNLVDEQQDESISRCIRSSFDRESTEGEIRSWLEEHSRCNTHVYIFIYWQWDEDGVGIGHTN